jgi:(S)-ureidoglycine aminohydrolase
VTSQYAVMPPEGILASALPGFRDTTVRIQTGPPMGARFAQMVLEMQPGGGTTAGRNDGLEHLFYLLSGSVTLTIDSQPHELTPHGYAYVPAGASYEIRAQGDGESRLIWIKRPYERIDLPAPEIIVGHRNDIPHSSEADQPGRYWQHLLPTDDLSFDMHVNILAFQPGVYFPYVETHVMEHGLYMLEGQMLYMLAGDLHEVEQHDFIWME